MNMLSINVRGMRVGGKAAWSKGLRKRYDVDFISLQEIQVSGVSLGEVSAFWGYGGLDFDVVDASGRSGGMINVWNSKVFIKLLLFRIKISCLLRVT